MTFNVLKLLEEEGYIKDGEDNIVHAEKAFFAARVMRWIRDQVQEDPDFNLPPYLTMLMYYKLGAAELRFEEDSGSDLLYKMKPDEEVQWMNLLTHLLNLLMKSAAKRRRAPPTPISTTPPKSLEELLMSPTNIMSLMKAKGYVFFDGADKKLNLNLIGVRRDNQGTNEFDDFMLVLYREEELMIQKRYLVTTDPGKYWLEHPINPEGTAVLIPNQYRSTWQLGKHQGKYEALVQRKKVGVWRDNNKDNIIDYNNLEVMNFGYYGINIHRSNPYTESYLVNKWSAGCQVFKRIAEYDEFLDLCKDSAAPSTATALPTR